MTNAAFCIVDAEYMNGTPRSIVSENRALDINLDAAGTKLKLILDTTDAVRVR